MRIKFTPIQILGIAFLLAGVLSFCVSFYNDSMTMALTGLGLTFWGVVFLYIHSEEYTKKSLVEATVPLSLATLENTLQELAYRGDPVYLPPSYFEEPETTLIYIAKQKGREFPTPENVFKTESRLVTKTSQGILLVPPGARLSQLLEDSLKTRFIRVDARYIQKKLPQVLVRDLEVAEKVEIEIEGNTTVHAKIFKSAYGNPPGEKDESSQLKNAICCPVCSAIAIALAKSSGKAVRIAQAKFSTDGRVTEARFEILEHQAS